MKKKDIILVAFWSEKGGVGKTTLCFNAAFGLAKAGLRVMVLDIDPQESIITLAGLNQAGVPFTVVKGPAQRRPTKKEYDVVLVDHPSRLIPPMEEASLVIMPLRPSALDLHAWFRSRQVLPPGVPTLAVLNGVDVRREEDRQFCIEMEKYKAVKVRERSIFKRQTGLGESVYSAGFRFGGNDAKADIDAIVNAIIKL